ncbi:non-ribosomal peptide synthetase [Herbaspirillum aquaticum]|uniref:Non-ribosomal peptide synthetase n=1 Tax=Herbaspirillum aquaticum TaxID=568783 RepID=A0A225SWT0_9BURK|nr:non-ribosomal peptide synthetase [Herbaspirillum aquaticum]
MQNSRRKGMPVLSQRSEPRSNGQGVRPAAACLSALLEKVGLAGQPQPLRCLQVGWEDEAFYRLISARWAPASVSAATADTVAYTVGLFSSLRLSAARKQTRLPLDWALLDQHWQAGSSQRDPSGYGLIVVHLDALGAQPWQSGLALLLAQLAPQGRLLLIGAQPDSLTGLEPLEQVQTDGCHGCIFGPSLPSFPLTDIQHAYWLGRGDSLSLGGVSCHVYFEWRIAGLDLQRMEQAWNQIIARHGMMRAVIDADGRQRILAELPHYAIAVDDWRDLAPSVQAEALAAKRARMCAQVLDAEHGPLFDLSASLEPGGIVRLHLDLDLLMFDVQSFHIVLAELEQRYHHPERSVDPIGLNFRDYMLAQQEPQYQLQYQQDRQWWLQRIETIAPAPVLPLACVPAELSHPEFIRLQHRLPETAWQSLSALASAQGITPSAVLLTAFAEVLATWAADPRFTLNLTHFNRRRIHPDVDQLVGDFTSVLLLTLDCSGTLSFVERARQVQASLWQCLGHTRFGGVEVLRELGRRNATDAAAGSLMPVVFTSLLGIDLDELVRGADTLGEPDFLYTCTPQVWLDHQVMVRKGSLEYNWIITRQLFPEGMAQAMFDSYSQLLYRLAQQPQQWEQPVGQLLPESQLRVRTEVNQTATAFTLGPLHAGFFAQCRRQPAAAALLGAHYQISYGQLGALVEQGMDRLRAHHIQPGHLVACALPKGPMQVAAALAILAVGAVLVPLPTGQGRERTRAIVERAGIDAILLDPAEPIEEPGCPRILMTPPAQWEAVPTAPLSSPVHQSALDDLAYIIYTSGSTGEPKGVAITHRAAANTLADIDQRIGLSAADRVFGISALHFDLAIYDVFATLSQGAALVLPAPDALRDAPHWLDLVQRHRVTVWNSVPALCRMLLEQAAHDDAGIPASLTRVMLSGDWIALDLPQALRQHAPQARLLALGGATEAAIWSNCFEVVEIAPEWKSIPYGFPLANQQYHILDAQGRDCPDWVTGRLFIAGAGLAREYWHAPDQTSASFSQHPRHGRLYNTGDLARYWPDGCIEFLGRVNSQVKLNGYRIELGEIEAALNSCPGVKASVVTVWRTPSGAQQLAGFVVPEPTATTVPLSGLPSLLAPVLQEAASQLPGDTDRDALARFQQQSEALAPLLILHNLIQLKLCAGQGAVLSLAALLDNHAVQQRYAPVLEAWMQILCDEQWLVPLGGQQWRVARSFPSSDVLQAALNEARTSLQGSLGWLDHGQAFLAWLFQSATSLWRSLIGQLMSTELIFPEGAREGAEGLYGDNIVAAYLGGIVVRCLQHQVQHCARPLALMEVGAGVGGLSMYALPALSQASPQSLYHYTDLSQFFLQIGREKFGTHAGARFALFDIDRTAEHQGIAPASLDLILASNVLHNALDLDASLSYLGSLLKPDGLLVLCEATRQKRLQWVTVAAVLEAAQDGAAQHRHSRLRGTDEWIEALGASGYEPIGAYPAEESEMGFVGQQVLVARWSRAVAACDDKSIRQHLAERLPAYMLPTHLQSLDALPLSANGKVDRSRLPAPVPASPSAAQPETPVRAGSESTLAAIWQDILQQPVTSRDSDFFQLGGDSLLVTRLAAAIRERFQVSIPIRQLFDTSRLEQQAQALAQLQADRRGASSAIGLVPLNTAAPAAPTLLCLPASDGKAMSYHALAGLLQGQVRCLGAELPAVLPPSMAGSIEAMAQHYHGQLPETERNSTTAYLGWSMGAYTAIEMARQHLALTGSRAAALWLIDPVDQSVMQSLAASEYGLLLSFLPEEGATMDVDAIQYEALAPAAKLACWRQMLAKQPLADQLDDTALRRYIDGVRDSIAAMVRYQLPESFDFVEAVYLCKAAQQRQVWADITTVWPASLCSRARCLSLPGDHWQSIRAAELAALIRQSLG